MKSKFIMFPRGLLRRSYSAAKRYIYNIVIAAGLFFCLPFVLSGQQPTLLLFHGIILDTDTRQPLTGTHFIVGNKTTGAADNNGMVSFYAHPDDTVRFTCMGYKDVFMVISDTLFAKEYTAGIFMTSDTLMIPDVVVFPRLTNLRTQILTDQSAQDQETVNAINNLKISTYQGLTGVNRLGDPAANYELLRQQQRIDAIEKGGIPSSAMVSLSPFTLIPFLYVLAKGLPEDPPPPQPFISAKEVQRLRSFHDSLIYRTNKK